MYSNARDETYGSQWNQQMQHDWSRHQDKYDYAEYCSRDDTIELFERLYFTQFYKTKGC